MTKKKRHPTIEETIAKIEHMKLRQRARDFKKRHNMEMPGWDYKNDRPKTSS